MNQVWGHKMYYTSQKLHLSGTFFDGINSQICLRKDLMSELIIIKSILSKEDYHCPVYLPRQKRYSNPIGYLLFCAAFTEDISCSCFFINSKTTVFDKYKDKINIPLSLLKENCSPEKIAEELINIDIDYLYKYIQEVYEKTNSVLLNFSYQKAREALHKPDVSECLIKGLLPVKINYSPYKIKYDTHLDLIEFSFGKIWIIVLEEVIVTIKKIKYTK